jgi:hypothetical protein
MTRFFPPRRLSALLTLAVPWLLTVAAHAAPAADEGKLVHVADTRNLSGFYLFVANLYNTDRLMFTLFSVGLTAVLGFGLGLLMDAIVGAIGLDLDKRHARE